MKIEVSNGELLDKISILELKMLKITDKEKLDNILTEFNSLNPLCVVLFEQFGSKLQKLYLQLAKVNSKLWDIEDWIRDCESENRFDKEFIELARSVYITNDERSKLKKEINILTESILTEEKSYKDYK